LTISKHDIKKLPGGRQTPAARQRNISKINSFGMVINLPIEAVGEKLEAEACAAKNPHETN